MKQNMKKIFLTFSFLFSIIILLLFIETDKVFAGCGYVTDWNGRPCTNDAGCNYCHYTESNCGEPGEMCWFSEGMGQCSGSGYCLERRGNCDWCHECRWICDLSGPADTARINGGVIDDAGQYYYVLDGTGCSGVELPSGYGVDGFLIGGPELNCGKVLNDRYFLPPTGGSAGVKVGRFNSDHFCSDYCLKDDITFSLYLPEDMGLDCDYAEVRYSPVDCKGRGYGGFSGTTKTYSCSCSSIGGGVMICDTTITMIGIEDYGNDCTDWSDYEQTLWFHLQGRPCGPCIPQGCGHLASLPEKKFAGLLENNDVKEVFLSNAEKREKSFVGLVNSEEVLTEINLTETQKSPILKIQLISASILEWFRGFFSLFFPDL